MLSENVDSPVIFLKTGKVKSSLQTFLDSQDESLSSDMYTVSAFFDGAYQSYIYLVDLHINVTQTQM